MSDATMPADDADWEAVDDASWTLLDREELVDAYWATVALAMEADGFNPDQEKPTHSWLRDHDFRPLLYALREYHDMTFGEFWSSDLELDAEARATTGRPITNGLSRRSNRSSPLVENGKASRTRQSICSATD